MSELIDRWTAFLKKIDSRCDEFLDQARVGCAQLLDLNQLDPQAMSNAWTGIRAQIHDLDDRIDEVWSASVEPAMESELEDQQVYEQERRGRALQDSMETRAEETEIEIFASAADSIVERAREILAQDFVCTQCSAPLPVPENFFRSVHVECEYCNRVNTFEPGTTARRVEHFCAHHMSQRAAIEEWRLRRRLDSEFRSRRDDEIDLAFLRRLEDAYRAFWSRYLNERAQMVPAYQDALEKDLEGKMGAFYREMQHVEAWPQTH